MKKLFIRCFYCACLIVISTQCTGGNKKPILNATITPDEKISTSQVDPGTVTTIVPEKQDTPTPATPTEILPTPAPAPVFIIGEQMDDFFFQTLDGTIISSSEQIGKPIIIVGWRASCPYCKRYLPMLQKTYEMYGGDFEIWALNFRDAPERIKQYVAENGLTFTIWPDAQGEVFYSNNIGTTPTTIFINSEGVVETIQEGILTEEAFIDKLEELEFIQK